MFDQTIIKEIAKLIRENSCVIFFGSGISVPSGLPSGNKLKESLGYPDLEFMQAMDIAWKKNQSNFIDIFNIFKNPSLKPNKLHQLLAMLQTKYYITTNYDVLFEQAFTDLGYQFPNFVSVYDDQNIADIPSSKHVLLKLHGDIHQNPKDMVSTTTSYLTINENRRIINSLFRFLISSYNVLFVGYGMSDINVIEQLLMHNNNPENGLKRFALMKTPNKQYLDYIESIGITIIPIEIQDLSSDQSKTIGDSTLAFLSALWLNVQDRNYVNRLDKNWLDPKTLEEYHERAWVLYRSAKYREALVLWHDFIALSEKQSHLMSPELFSRFAYFYIKVHDKLELFGNEMVVAENYINKYSSKYQAQLPDAVWKMFEMNYKAGLSIPKIRTWLYIEAIQDISQVLQYMKDLSVFTDPDVEELVQQGDWLTISALAKLIKLIDQNLSETDRSSLERSITDDISQANNKFEEYQKIKRDDIHYLGRYFGVLVFFELTRITSTGITPNQENILLKKSGTTHGLQVTNVRNLHSNIAYKRVPYGLIAGLYCDAYCRFYLAKNIDNLNRKFVLLYESLCLLLCAFLKTKELSITTPLVLAKLYGLKWQILKWVKVNNYHNEPTTNPMVKQMMDELDSSYDEFNQNWGIIKEKNIMQIDLGVENNLIKWLKTPLN